jgi:hypothetical protein
VRAVSQKQIVRKAIGSRRIEVNPLNPSRCIPGTTQPWRRRLRIRGATSSAMAIANINASIVSIFE